MTRVGVVGYGTIGKRVADAVGRQPDMELAGVAKRSPDYAAAVARDRGIPLFSAGADGENRFAGSGVRTAGTVADLVERADVVVDATPAGTGARNRELYRETGTPAVFQGGEDADVGVSFNARSNYEDVRDADYVRVVSCNTTGLARVFAPLEEAYGIDRARVTLVRRGGDPDQTDRGPINDTVPNPLSVPSHHGPDVRTVLPDVRVDTMGMKVPTTLMHTHAVNVSLESEPHTAEVRELLDDETRLFVLPERLGVDGAGKIKELALDAGRPRGDCWENCVWGESVTTDGSELYLFQAIHQEADVVLENIDAVRALSERTASATQSIQRTDAALGVGEGLVQHDDGAPQAEGTADD